jgi:hypothetical protein
VVSAVSFSGWGIAELGELSFFAIVGVGRSGTSLLMCMLDAHPDIAMPPESHFVGQYVVKRAGVKLPQLIAHLSHDNRFARLGLSIEEITQPFLEYNEPFSVARMYQVIMKIYATKRGVRVVGDKAPKNIEYLPVLRSIFPEACIIHLIRDPRDVYLSRTKTKWSGSRPAVLQYLAYRSQYGLGRRLGPQLFGDRYLEVHYENLITRPVTELSRVCSLVNLPFDNSMLDFQVSAKELVFADELTWKKEVLGPLLTQNKNKWQQELTPEQAARVEAACSPTFKDGFYELSGKGDARRSRLACLLINTYMPILDFIYQQSVMHRNRKALRSVD